MRRTRLRWAGTRRMRRRSSGGNHREETTFSKNGHSTKLGTFENKSG